jgi:hypothetical protein
MRISSGVYRGSRASRTFVKYQFRSGHHAIDGMVRSLTQELETAVRFIAGVNSHGDQVQCVAPILRIFYIAKAANSIRGFSASRSIGIAATPRALRFVAKFRATICLRT